MMIPLMKDYMQLSSSGIRVEVYGLQVVNGKSKDISIEINGTAKKAHGI